jgi:transcriptional regulator of acetoin/glycerol metabolism
MARDCSCVVDAIALQKIATNPSSRESALEQTGGNFYEAARLLDVHRTYLYRLAGNLKIPSE